MSCSFLTELPKLRQIYNQWNHTASRLFYSEVNIHSLPLPGLMILVVLTQKERALLVSSGDAFMWNDHEGLKPYMWRLSVKRCSSQSCLLLSVSVKGMAPGPGMLLRTTLVKVSNASQYRGTTDTPIDSLPTCRPLGDTHPCDCGLKLPRAQLMFIISKDALLAS